MIYVTGDTHGDIDFLKLKNPIYKDLTKQDYVIIAGDCGVLFFEGEKEKMIEAYSNLPFTVLFVDGNHENFTLLNDYPIEEWNGGKIHRISKSILHLMRGQIFEIEGIKFFTFGGALSIDKIFRTPYYTWWPEEMPTEEELEEGIKNLEKYQFVVDYVITHDCPLSLLTTVLLYSTKGNNCKVTPAKSNEFLELIANKITCKQWFFGHYHIDQYFGKQYTALYKKVLLIENDN
ncbi:MAG: metallophosphoesterase [Anaeroplasmataceae bacterium]|nr:metallophosphoesterase [Anaeroplasmataceae bacterium]